MNLIAKQPAQRAAWDYVPVWLALAAGFIVSAGVAGWFWGEAEHLDKIRFHSTITNLIDRLDASTARYGEELQRFADFLATQPEVSETIWQECISRPAPPGNLPAFVELAYVSDPTLPSRGQVEELLRANATPSGKAILPKPSLHSVFVMRHWRNACIVTPQETETWLQQPGVNSRWWSMMDGRLIASPRRLIEGLDGKPFAAVSLFVPMFAGDLVELMDRHSPDEVWRMRAYRFKGFIVGTIRWEPFRDAAFAASGGQVKFEAFADALNAAQITANHGMGVRGSMKSEVLDPTFRPRFQHVQAWPFYRARWQLAFYSTELFNSQSTRGRAWVALSAGMGLTLLMGGLLAVQVRARRKQELITGQLQKALEELDSARREREQLSYDLHDGAIQSLYALQLSLSRASEQAHPALGRRLSEIRRNVSAVIGELRTFILRHEAGSRPSGDLVSVLSAVVERLRASTETVLCNQLSPEASRRLASEQAVHLANLAREALSNALRHANARRVTMTLRDEADGVALTIEDDGCGFNIESPLHKGLGLTSMTSRARDAGGEFRIESRPGEGTRVLVFIPVPSVPTLDL